MYYLCFDTETSGLPVGKYNTRSYTNVYLYQLAYKLYDNKYNCIKTFSSYIKNHSECTNDNFIINKINGITESQLHSGKSIIEVLDEFEKDIMMSKLLIAHNIEFDYNVIITESQRLNKLELIRLINSIPKFDTMIISGKWGINCINKIMPKLSELYYRVLKTTDKDINLNGTITKHDALSDTDQCWTCFKFLINDWGKVKFKLGQFNDKDYTYIYMLNNEENYCKWALRQNATPFGALGRFIEYIKYSNKTITKL